jgi:hypothetical protein
MVLTRSSNEIPPLLLLSSDLSHFSKLAVALFDLLLISRGLPNFRGGDFLPFGLFRLCIKFRVEVAAWNR